MRDKSPDKFLLVLFVIGGIAIMILTWVQPMSLVEKVFATLVAVTALGGMLVRAMLPRPVATKTGVEKINIKQVKLQGGSGNEESMDGRE